MRMLESDHQVACMAAMRTSDTLYLPRRRGYFSRPMSTLSSQQQQATVSRERLGLLLGFIGMMIFGGTLPATRIAVSAIEPVALTAMRTAIAGLCSLMLLIVLRR